MRAFRAGAICGGIRRDRTSETGSGMSGMETVRFGEKLAGSENFRTLFREGMALVEETASYLDGRGRDESRDLPRPASLTYATESMRLTTRLMQIASWLLLQRAVNEGEMTAEQAGQEKNKVRLNRLSSAMSGPGWDELPTDFRDLIERSVRLQERVRHLDGLIYDEEPGEKPAAENPVAAHMSRLAAAFPGQSED